jgi:hypothetical protein
MLAAIVVRAAEPGAENEPRRYGEPSFTHAREVVGLAADRLDVDRAGAGLPDDIEEARVHLGRDFAHRAGT